MSAAIATTGTPTQGAKALQERLNQLLSKLSSSIEVIKNWPSTDGDDASIHVKTTSKLIDGILEIKRALERVEGVVQSNLELQKSLQNCPVPINLLDLLDHGNGLNPDCFSRGLLREALGQLAGLKRRKNALEMLGAAVQKGLDNRLCEPEKKINVKRQRVEETGDQEKDTETIDEPATKRVKTEIE